MKEIIKIVTASAAIIQNKKVLLVKRREDALLFPGHWAFPGGRAETGETPEQIAVREVKEETNLDFLPEQLLLTSKYDNRIMYRFSGRWSGKIVLQQEELTEYGWFSFHESEQLQLAFDYQHVISLLFRKGLID